MKKLTAVIIKGNPKFISGNEKAENFYNEIKRFLENLDFEVSLDPGEAHTSPKEADLWIGHSRGADRLRFPKSNVVTLAIGSAVEGAINHPNDNTKDMYGESDIEPNEFHYEFTEEMKEKIKYIKNKLINNKTK